jgi:dihydroorotase
MPNTTPAIDSPEWVTYIVEKAKQASAKVYPIAAITPSLKAGTLPILPHCTRRSGRVSDDGRPGRRATDGAGAAGRPRKTICGW